jgi:phosphotransferase system HPr (HPr) family protein
MAATARLIIRNPSGLHARPAALFVRTAAVFAAEITVRNLTRAGAAADAKSIIGVLGLGVGSGNLIEVSADGPDADRAIDAIVELVDCGIGEAAEAG